MTNCSNGKVQAIAYSLNAWVIGAVFENNRCLQASGPVIR